MITVSLFYKSINDQFKDNIQDRGNKLSFKLTYFKSFNSSLKFYPMWVTRVLLTMVCKSRNLASVTLCG